VPYRTVKDCPIKEKQRMTVYMCICHLPVSAALAVCGLIVTVGDGHDVSDSDSAPQIQL